VLFGIVIICRQVCLPRIFQRLVLRPCGWISFGAVDGARASSVGTHAQCWNVLPPCTCKTVVAPGFYFSLLPAGRILDVVQLGNFFFNQILFQNVYHRVGFAMTAGKFEIHSCQVRFQGGGSVNGNEQRNVRSLVSIAERPVRQLEQSGT